MKHQGEATAFNLTRLGFVPLVVADARPQKLFASWRQRIGVDRLIVIVPPILDRAAARAGLASPAAFYEDDEGPALLRAAVPVAAQRRRTHKGLIPRPAVPLDAGSVFWKRFATANVSRSTMRTAIDRVKPFQLALIRDLRFAGTSEAEPVEQRVSFKVTGYSGLNSVPVHAITAGVRLGSTDAHRCEPML